MPLTDKELSEQDARYTIDGAIALGRTGTNRPPQGHWLTEYWSIGQQLAELGKTSAWDNQTPVDAPQCRRCGGSKVVDDGEITGCGGVEFSNGPIACVKDCPDCAAPSLPAGDGLTDESAMRIALQIMANLEDRNGVLDDVDDDTKTDIADEIAVSIRTGLAAPRQPGEMGAGVRMMTDEHVFELVGQVLGQPLIAEDLREEDLREGFTVHTESRDWIAFARAIQAASPMAPANEQEREALHLAMLWAQDEGLPGTYEHLKSIYERQTACKKCGGQRWIFRGNGEDIECDACIVDGPPESPAASAQQDEREAGYMPLTGAMRLVREKLARFEECAADDEGCDIGREWFDALTTIGLLARTQRSPAMWSMTPAGEAMLAQQVQADAGAVLVSRADLEAIDAAMQHLGDVLNGMDAVEAEDEEKTEPGFEAISRILASAPSRPAAESDKRDAERYRWLRDENIVMDDDQRSLNVVMGRLPFREDQKDEDMFGDELDEAIDAAMSREQSGGSE